MRTSNTKVLHYVPKVAANDTNGGPGPIEAGKPLASGRAADVFDQGDGTVLRRYRDDHDSKIEARAMNWLADRGLPISIGPTRLCD